MKKIIFAVKGMSCASCVAHVERAVRGTLPDSMPFTVSLLSGNLTITAPDDCEETALFKKLQQALRRAGYGLARNGETDEAEEKKEKKRARNRLVLSIVLTALLMIAAMWHMTPIKAPFILDAARYPCAFFLLQFVLTLSVVFLERHFYRSGFSALFHGAPNMDSLVALGSGASLLYGLFAGVMIFIGAGTGNHEIVHRYLHELYLESAAMILTLVSVGKYLEGRARNKASGAVRALLSEEPQTARVIRGEKREILPLADLAVSDLVEVFAGEKIPADGVVESGEGSVNEAMLTGESLPREVTAGATVSGATILCEGALCVRVRRVGEESTLRRIAALLEETASAKAPAARLADKVSAVFVPAVLGISLLTAAVWLIFFKNPPLAFRTAVSVLVISCPCALGLATPTAITVGSGRGARYGILYKSAEALETVAGVKILLTDKTGTLTKGKMALSDRVIFEGDGEEADCVLSSLEKHSAHPVAQPLSDLAKRTVPVADFRSLAGLGLCGSHPDGEKVFAGGRALFSGENGAPALTKEASEAADRLERDGKSLVFVSKGDRILGLYAVADSLREDSKAAVKELTRLGVRTVMLTGDNEGTAAAVAKEAGISEYRAGLLPADKEKLIAEYRREGMVAMVGDGINDAPALAGADVGMAIGAGTEVALSSADVVLSGNSLFGAAAAIELGRATKRNILENLFWALFYNALCIPLAAGVLYPRVLLTPMIASLCMSFSSVFVVLNALRLSRFVPPCLRESEKERKKLETKEREKMFFKKKELKKEELTVQGMMCAHCVAHVKKALEAVPGVKEVTIELKGGHVTVLHEGAPREALEKAVEAAGYEVKK